VCIRRGVRMTDGERDASGSISPHFSQSESAKLSFAG
jgi:hypothetical protein